MHATTLELPERQAKPRATGLTMVIDNGLPTGQFADAVASFSATHRRREVRLGHLLVTDDLERKIDALADASTSASASAGRCSRSSSSRTASTAS